jgi:hypothetical protein
LAIIILPLCQPIIDVGITTMASLGYLYRDIPFPSFLDQHLTILMLFPPVPSITQGGITTRDHDRAIYPEYPYRDQPAQLPSQQIDMASVLDGIKALLRPLVMVQ